MTTIPVGSMIGDREVLRTLGSGGMGEVLLTRNIRLGRLEAVKATLISASGTTAARFVAEATTLASLDHPNIATIYQFGVTDQYFWYAMKYLPGDDLAAQLPVTVDDAVRIIRQVGMALEYAHSMGVVHRDVKPANIHVQRASDGTVSTATVLDFGVAKAPGTTALTEVNSFVGTLSYSAPERIAGAETEPSADQYSFACTAFEMLTGHLPYPQQTLTALIAAHASAPVPAVSAVDPRLSACDPVFHRALAKSPQDRYPTCGDFARDLIAALTSHGTPRYTDERTVDAGHAPRTPTGRPPTSPQNRPPMPPAPLPPPIPLPSPMSAPSPPPTAPPSGPPSPPLLPRTLTVPQRSPRPVTPEKVFARRRRIAAAAAVLVLIVATVGISWVMFGGSSSPVTQPSPVSARIEAGSDPDAARRHTPQRTGALIPEETSAPSTGITGTGPRPHRSDADGPTWALLIDPAGQTYAFGEYPDRESLVRAAADRWQYDPRTWSIVSFDSGCAAFARPIGDSQIAYQSGLGRDRQSAENTAVTKSEQIAGRRSHLVDVLCVGDRIE